MNWLPRDPAPSDRSPVELDHGQPIAETAAYTLYPERTRSAGGREATILPPGGTHPVPVWDASMILPIYNEQACIEATLAAVVDYAERHPSYEFLFVNDGSTDRTATMLRDRIPAALRDRIRVVSYPQRGGKGYAVQQGVAAATGRAICFLDGDLAYSLEHLDALLAALDYAEVAIGCRSLVAGNHQGLKPSRWVAGKVFNLLSRAILNLRYVDMQAGLKGFRRSAAKRLFSLQTLHGFSFDVELIYLARKQGYAIAEVPARVSRQHSRKQSKVNLIQDSLRMFKDLLRIRWNDWLGRYD